MLVLQCNVKTSHTPYITQTNEINMHYAITKQLKNEQNNINVFLHISLCHPRFDYNTCASMSSYIAFILSKVSLCETNLHHVLIRKY